MSRFPKIDVDIDLRDEVVNLVEGSFDLAIRIGTLSDSDMMARQLTDHRRITCASPTYIEEHGAPETPSQLARYQFLRFSLSTDDRWVFVHTAGDHQRNEIQVNLKGRVRINDTDAMLELAILGHGVALLPSWACDHALRDGRLVELLPGWEARLQRAETAVWAVYPRKKTVSSKVRAFIDFYANVVDLQAELTHFYV
ncbi:hypothetical protein IPC1598_25895 [Pseudomonas aeruginosa]|nr:substrate binding domain-containing protein [Burkholderia cenocepacia]TEC04289.1 hypothetical protein IPC1598_25895 [Pseudomonas aeruginosa]